MHTHTHAYADAMYTFICIHVRTLFHNCIYNYIYRYSYTYTCILILDMHVYLHTFIRIHPFSPYIQWRTYTCNMGHDTTLQQSSISVQNFDNVACILRDAQVIHSTLFHVMFVLANSLGQGNSRLLGALHGETSRSMDLHQSYSERRVRLPSQRRLVAFCSCQISLIM